jgi:hypothetical protein
MLPEIITPETISKEILKAALDAAFVDVTFDSDGDLKAKDEVLCYISLNEKKDRISLFTSFGIKKEASPVHALLLANEINKQYVIVRAYFREESSSLRFEYDICVGGGITLKAFVLAFKRYCSIPRTAISKSDTNDIIE